MTAQVQGPLGEPGALLRWDQQPPFYHPTSCEWNHTIFVLCVWLISLSIMSSRFINVVAGVRISFLFKLNSIPFLCIYCVLFIHSSVNGHLGWFHLLAIVNYAAMNMGVQISVWALLSNSLGVHTQEWDYCIIQFNLLRNCHTVVYSGLAREMFGVINLPLTNS